MKEGLCHTLAIMAGEQAQMAPPIRKQRKGGLRIVPNCFLTCEVTSLCVYDERMVVKTGHYPLDVMTVKRIEVPLDEVFFGCHGQSLLML
jgi:hypothetical protein